MTEETVSVTIDSIRDAMGEEAEEFLYVLKVTQQIIDNPESFFGPKALVEATRLAAYRTRISIKAQFYKTTSDKSLVNRKRKDVLMSMYASLEENIQTLKLMGKVDATLAGVLR